MTYFSSRQVAALLNIREFTRLCDVLDKHTQEANTKFNIIQIERNGATVKVFMELGIGNLKKITLTGTTTSVQQEDREQPALVKVNA